MSEDSGLDLDLSGVLESSAGTATAAPEQKQRPTTQTSRPRGKQPLIFDLETVPDESRLEQFGLEPLPTPRQFTPTDQLPDPANLVTKKVDEIKKAVDGIWPSKEWLEKAIVAEKSIEKPRKGVLDEFAGIMQAQLGEGAMILGKQNERRKILSVTPEFCRIVAMGSARGDAEIKTAVVGQLLQFDGKEHKLTESDLLESWWLAVEECSPLVGFNIVGFDLPVIFIRSALLGIRPTRKIDTRPWGGEVIDLMQARWPKGGQKSLKDTARILGFKVPAEGVDGSHVDLLWREGRLAEIAAYQASDIEVTRQLFSFLKGFFF